MLAVCLYPPALRCWVAGCKSQTIILHDQATRLYSSSRNLVADSSAEVMLKQLNNLLEEVATDCRSTCAMAEGTLLSHALIQVLAPPVPVAETMMMTSLARLLLSRTVLRWFLTFWIVFDSSHANLCRLTVTVQNRGGDLNNTKIFIWAGASDSEVFVLNRRI